MTNITRTLVLMRHGKSGYPEGALDHDRPLAKRGVREAELAGRWVRATLPAVDSVLCSTAARTRETLAATGLDAPVEYCARIYEASPETIVDEIRLTADDVRTLLVVGHAPGVPWTAWELAANRDDTATEQLVRKFPTSALAVLRFDGPWSEIGPGTGELTHFEIPR